MKIKRVTTEQAELTDKEIEILSKVKQYCNSQVDCANCLFNCSEDCKMRAIWSKLGKLNVNYGDIK